MRVADLPTPALVVDTTALTHNLDTMTAALPGARLRPHVKAHKCTALAPSRPHAATSASRARHRASCSAWRAPASSTICCSRTSPSTTLDLRALAGCEARITVAVDSEATIDAAARNGIREVLVDVNVGIPRCGVRAADAGALADLARARGLTVRGTMGYEGHAVLVPDRPERAALTDASMDTLPRAHAAVGGPILSGGGTGTYDVNTVATEIQAGSYALMDTAYAQLDLPFELALAVVATVIHTNPKWAVADCGLKALGMDHGNPAITGASVMFCSDEHVTFTPDTPVRVGDRVLVTPAHVDPTVAYHDALHLADGPGAGATVVDRWPVDLRGWDEG